MTGERTQKLGMAALVLLTIAGSAGAYPGIEHALLALKSFSAWQDFDPSFYDALTAQPTPGTQAALDRYMCVKFYLIGAMIPDLFEPGAPALSRGVIEKLYLAKDFVTGPIKISDETKSQVDSTHEFVWHDDLRPNNDFPALHRMALMARSSNWTNREKAMIYGAYLHVVQDLHCACFQNPSLWGTCFVAEPASVINDFAPLNNVEFVHNMFELTNGVTAADWDSVTYYLFGQSAGSDPNIEIGHMQLTFYRHVVNWGPWPPREVEEWQDLDFPEVAKFVQAANTYFSVDSLTPERLEAYMQGFAITWFMLAGYTNQDYQQDAGGVFAHTNWNFGDITEYVYGIAYDQFQWWVYPIIWTLEGFIRSIIANCLHMTPDLGFAVAELTGLNDPWPSYFESPDAISNWVEALREKYGDIPQELEDYVNTAIPYVSTWTRTYRGANPCLRATYSGEFNTAVDLIPEQRRVLTGGPAKLSHVMDTPVAGTQVYQMGLKAGLVGGMYEGNIGDRQPGIARIGLVRRGLSLHSALEVPTGGGDPNTAKLFYDLLPFGPFVRVSLMAKTTWQGQWQVVAQSDVTDRQYSRVIDSLQVSLQALAQQGYRFLSYRVTNTPAGQIAVNSDYKAAYDDPVFQGQTPYGEWLRYGETRRAPDQNPFTSPKENWPCVSEIVPKDGWWYLEMPSELTVRMGNSGQLAVELAWTDNSSYEYGYKIEKTVNHSSPTYIGLLPANTTNYEDLDVAFGDTYRYRVWCERDEWKSDTTPYAEIVVTVTADFPPTAYNNQNKVVVNGNDVHMTYSTGSNVMYLHSSDGGKTWDAPEDVGVLSGEGSPCIALNSEGQPCILYPGGWGPGNDEYWWLPYWVTWRRPGRAWDFNMAFVIKGDPNHPQPQMDPPVASFCMRGDTWFAALDYPGHAYCLPENPGTYFSTHVLAPHTSLGSTCGSLDSIARKSTHSLPTVLVDASGRRLVVSTYGDDGDTVIRISYMDAGQSTFSSQEYKWREGVYNITAALERDTNLLLAWGSSGYDFCFARFVKGTPGYTPDPAEIVPDLADWQHTRPKFVAGRSNLPMLMFEHDPTGNADIWYATRVAPGSWIADTILTSDYFLGYPQGFRAGSRLGVFASGSEELCDPPYYLVSGSLDLPWYQFPPISNEYATWPNSGRKLVVSPDGANAHVVYDGGGSVQYSASHDGGETWGDPLQLDAGYHPSIALYADDLPTVVYERNDSVFCKMRRSDGTWRDAVVYAGGISEVVGPPAVGQSEGATMSCPYCAFPVFDNGTNVSRVWLVKLDTLNGFQSQWLAAAPLGVVDSFVSVACTPGGPVHVAWERPGVIMYASVPEGGMPIVQQVSQLPASHPFVEAHGDRVDLIWRDLQSGCIVMTAKYVWGVWEQSVIFAPGDFPACSRLGTAVFEQPDAMLADEIWAHVSGLPNNLSESPNVSSEYPHLDAGIGLYDDTLTIVDTVYSTWTENVGQSLYSVRFRKLGLQMQGQGCAMRPMSPSNTAVCGEEAASPHCPPRSEPDAVAGAAIDCGDSLSYLIRYIDPRYNYLAEFTVAPEQRLPSAHSFRVQGEEIARLRFGPGRPNTARVIVPRRSYENGTTLPVTLNRLTGERVTLAGLKLYAFSPRRAWPDGVTAEATPLVLEPRLHNAVPNPSRGRTVLRYQVPRPMHVTLKIYDASGRVVRTVLDSEQPAGAYNLTWDGCDRRGRMSPNGIYFCTMKAGDYSGGKKLVISR